MKLFKFAVYEVWCKSSSASVKPAFVSVAALSLK